MLTLTDIANGIVALDRAAHDASLDAEGMAEAQAVAARLMCWATAQLKSEAELAAAAEGGGTSGVFDAGGMLASSGTAARGPAAPLAPSATLV